MSVANRRTESIGRATRRLMVGWWVTAVVLIGRRAARRRLLIGRRVAAPVSMVTFVRTRPAGAVFGGLFSDGEGRRKDVGRDVRGWRGVGGRGRELDDALARDFE